MKLGVLQNGRPLISKLIPNNLVEINTKNLSQSAMLQFLRLLCSTKENSLHTNCGYALPSQSWF